MTSRRSPAWLTNRVSEAMRVRKKRNWKVNPRETNKNLHKGNANRQLGMQKAILRKSKIIKTNNKEFLIH